jgi:putative ABC transport system ATP-binding protein
MIELRGVTKTYGKKKAAFTALDNVTVTIPDGATVAIVGKSGSGKSTLMHAMSGLDRPEVGEVIVSGQDILRLRGRKIDQFRAHEMGFIFQAFFVQANDSCYQNVALPLEIAGVPRKERRALIEAALEEVELSDKLTAKARNLSGGQKQRLAIARAIVNKPKIIFADEPTGNLDSLTSEKIEDLLFSLNKSRGTTLVIVTHDEELAARCQYRLDVKDGKVGALEEVQA